MSNFHVIDECMEIGRRVVPRPAVIHCEAYRSEPGDRTGENAQECGARAWWFCETCELYLCEHDSLEPCSLFPFEHKLTPAKEVAHA